MNIPPADLPVIVLYNADPAWSPADTDEIEKLAALLVEELSAIGHPVQAVCLEQDNLSQVMAGFDPEAHIVFNWCEEIPGIPRSASLVAQGLEELGFTFTGADSQALILAQDKPAVKQVLTKAGLPTPRWQLCTSPDPGAWDCFPAIVKPAFEHCSFGISHEAVVHTSTELNRRMAQVTSEFNQPVIVEEFIDGREFHVSIVGNGKLQVFPIAEMDFSALTEDSSRLCTYESKFAPASADYQLIQLRLPAELTQAERRQLEKTALAAYRVTNCRDYARLDIRQKDGSFHVLDVNPNADISPDTSLTLSAGLVGYTFGGFGSLLVGLAARRHPVFGRQELSPEALRRVEIAV